jgi:hypothetical protein
MNVLGCKASANRAGRAAATLQLLMIKGLARQSQQPIDAPFPPRMLSPCNASLSAGNMPFATAADVPAATSGKRFAYPAA